MQSKIKEKKLRILKLIIKKLKYFITKQRIASASELMWYPNFAKYVKMNEISKNTDKVDIV